MKNNLLKRIVVRRLFPFGSIRTIWLGPCAGMKIKLSLSMSHSILRGYERPNQRFLRKKIRTGMAVYDVGANSGQYALFFARLVGSAGRVACFEPVPSIFEELLFHTKLNCLDQILCQNVGLSDADGTTTFLINPDLPTRAKNKNVEPSLRLLKSVELSVQTCRLDSLQDSLFPPDIIKLDVEGSAGLVLKGGYDTLTRYKPSLFIELHGPEERKTVDAILHELNYGIEDLKGNKLPNLADSLQSPIWCCPPK